jgi:hypothetical protein
MLDGEGYRVGGAPPEERGIATMAVEAVLSVVATKILDATVDTVVEKFKDRARGAGREVEVTVEHEEERPDED